jgi:hypothetical protein
MYAVKTKRSGENGSIKPQVLSKTNVVRVENKTGTFSQSVFFI